MAIQIAKNDFYELSVDKAKNRIYARIIGRWENAAQIPNYLADFDKIISQVTRGFTMLSDLTKSEPPPTEILFLHEEASKKVVSAGCGKLAQVLPASAIVKTATDRVARQSQLVINTFSSLAEAEAWLDQK